MVSSVMVASSSGSSVPWVKSLRVNSIAWYSSPNRSPSPLYSPAFSMFTLRLVGLGRLANTTTAVLPSSGTVTDWVVCHGSSAVESGV